MRAGAKFAQILEQQGMLGSTKSVVVKVYGSLELTGFGHGTFTAIQLGLEGSLPASVDIDTMPARLEAIRSERTLLLNGSHRIAFDPRTDIEIRGDELLPYHTNGMSFAALGDPAAPPLFEETYYSIGGGFFVDHDGVKQDDSRAKVGQVSSGEAPRAAPFPFANAAELFALCEREGTTVAELARRNELSERSEEELDRYLAAIWTTMDACIERGMRASGPLEEGGAVVRRASMDRNWLKRAGAAAEKSDWVVAWAMAVNEENAAGGRVVTAPTNGAAGILPAVCKYYSEFVPGANANGLAEMLLTASVIGGLFKKGASISGAEVGCQGEVGVACSMAAGSLAAALGGSLRQVEMAAEIAMEHNLGLTCDPVGDGEPIDERCAWHLCKLRGPVHRSTARCKSRASSATDWVRRALSTRRGSPCEVSTSG